MHRRRPLLARPMFALVLFAGLVFAASPAAADAAVKVVADLFAAHARAFADKGPSVIDGDKHTARYFTAKATAGWRAWKDRSWDPVFNGNDAKITALRIRRDPSRKPVGGTVFVLVTFKNFGDPQRAIYHVRETAKGRWRIDDIETRRWTLNQIFAEVRKKS